MTHPPVMKRQCAVGYWTTTVPRMKG